VFSRMPVRLVSDGLNFLLLKSVNTSFRSVGDHLGGSLVVGSQSLGIAGSLANAADRRGNFPVSSEVSSDQVIPEAREASEWRISRQGGRLCDSDGLTGRAAPTSKALVAGVRRNT